MNPFNNLRTIVFYHTFENLSQVYHEFYPDDPNWKNRDIIRINNNICSNPFERMIIFKMENKICIIIDGPNWNNIDSIRAQRIIEEVAFKLAQDFNCKPKDFEINVNVLATEGYY